MFILEPSDVTRALARKKVTVFDFPDGRVEVRHKGLALPYRTFDRVTRVNQGAIVENKRLSEALEMCRAIQAQLPPKKRSGNAPARSGQRSHMFTPARVSPMPLGISAPEVLPPVRGGNDRIAAGLELCRLIEATLPAKGAGRGVPKQRRRGNEAYPSPA